MIEEGQPAPSFTLPSDSGEQVSLEEFRGRPVVLYFYPKDDTPGCTKQASGLRDAWGEFEKRGAVVLGVSPDGERSHAKFRDKYELPFTLLADEDHAVAETYGVWVEKSFAGSRSSSSSPQTYRGVERSTFVIDENGIMVKIMRKVKPDTHADEVLAVLDAPSSRAAEARARQAERPRLDQGERTRPTGVGTQNARRCPVSTNAMLGAGPSASENGRRNVSFRGR